MILPPASQEKDVTVVPPPIPESNFFPLVPILSMNDQLVNYTANLTEERDELNANLEEAKKALQREMATRIALESKGHMPHGRKVRACLHSKFSCQASFHTKLLYAGWCLFVILVSKMSPKLSTHGCRTVVVRFGHKTRKSALLMAASRRCYIPLLCCSNGVVSLACCRLCPCPTRCAAALHHPTRPDLTRHDMA